MSSPKNFTVGSKKPLSGVPGVRRPNTSAPKNTTVRVYPG